MQSQDPSPKPPPQTETFESTSSSKNSFREYVSRRRRWLCAGAILLVLVICVGIILTAHHFFVAFGGQGYLKARVFDATREASSSKAYLPMRKVETFSDDGRQYSRSSLEVPYYACGDQQSSCEAYNQPDVCCPVKMSCRPTPLTPSNIYCCNSTDTDLACENFWNGLPRCMSSYFPCLAEEGGGCCPNNTLCSPNGCIEVHGPSTIAPSATTNSGQVTITEVPATTATIMKQGEIAQSGVGARDSVALQLCLPYSCVSFLVFVAALMGFL